ncbi:NAD-dependent epimerase/dehydratase family protein [Helicobacter saguini]|uniref:NAD(P)-dependent oxidoreductase n=2 Tax=Helicobacter saguini TaxID=1548018 RepID=A0A347VPQ9_9HELI|nr:NAD-dependent epimerase/dehydratase family protein [Helicobacter saguini]MWV68079.1 NAD-dependent epimerase/dehydratase family protein [Helicobacter saguini]MWV72358.1 NAD-dependent epimerase/dehydratase family protein [Helicobacter saguini]TLD93006.1 NAD(P)-dependent oxidoreductase [Helicobacter saguini]
MMQAIITGATGFIGSRLARLLLNSGYEVLALGRKKWSEVDSKRLCENLKLTYIQLDMKDVSKLAILIKKHGFKIKKNCVFFHFAWGDSSGLSSLNVAGQYENVLYTIESFKVAAAIKCARYIYVGSMEEWFASEYLTLDYKIHNFFNRHVIYALPKKCARDFLKAIAINYDIDLIIATNSHILGPNDTRDSFLKVTMEKLINNEYVEMTSGVQNFDCVNVSDCALAYKIIAQKGKKNAEYHIGSSTPKTLKEYVESMMKFIESKEKRNARVAFGKVSYNDIILDLELFKSSLLQSDTGFKCEESFEDGLNELYLWLKFAILNESD